MKDVEVWFELASTYSYLAVTRIEALARASNVALAWRPFLLGPLFQQQGWSDSPFNVYPAKGRYMWRDMERLCAEYALPLKRPSVFPRNTVLATRVALIAADEGWCAPFACAIYRANFAEDRDIAAREVVKDAIAFAERDPESVLARAETPEHKLRLRAQTSRAQELGLFGAPTFLVGGEMFWGNDRLEQAIAWARK